MALAIGFANKYYTLWSVESVENYTTYPNGQHLLSSISCNRYYYKNLSMNKDEALKKAKIEGVKCLEVDTELKGKTRSWSTNEYISYDYKDYEFNGGKYNTMDIRKCEDLDYLLWWKNDNDWGKKYVLKRIVELDDNYVIYKKNLYTKSELSYIKIKGKIENGKIEMVAISNFSFSGEDDYYTVRLMIANPKGKLQNEYNEKVEMSWDAGRFTVNLKNFDLAHRSYNGYKYTTLNGKRSFKGTNLFLKTDSLLETIYSWGKLTIDLI
jgi:hypothetical protein